MSEYQIKAVYDQTEHLWRIDDLEATKRGLEGFISTTSLASLAITGDDDAKAVKKARTAIRKKKDEITKTRLQINEQLLGEVNRGFKELESRLKAEDDAMKAHLDAYAESLEANEPKAEETVGPKTGRLLIEGSAENLAKVKEFALSLGCVVQTI